MSYYIKKSDVRHLLLHNDQEAALAKLDELEGLDPALTKAVELLDSEYQTAKNMEYIFSPVCFALYSTWKKAEEERQRKGNKNAKLD